MERTGRTSPLFGAALAALAIVASHAPAAAQWSASFPSFAACQPETPPKLPPRWHAVALMSPFLQGQLDVGDLTFDGTVPALRASIYGLESGAVDLLITEDETYHLTGPHGAPTACRSLGRKFTVPTEGWVSDKGACYGQAQLGTKHVQWWKTPGVGPEATYHWFTSDTRLPWRSVFLSRAGHPAIVGDYALTNFPTFTPLQKTNLPELREFCRARATPAPAAAAAAHSARALMGLRNIPAEDERLDRITKLIPGLTLSGCAKMKPVRWPDHFVMTAVISPINFAEDPNPALIYYDWETTKTQLAVMFHGRPPKPEGLVSLKYGVGYRLLRTPRGPTCDAVYPGMVRPDWMTVAACQCKGVLDHNRELSPRDVTQILSCPIRGQQHRIMWNWYTSNGKPVMFKEAGPEGGGLMLADYYDWLPGQKIPPKDFDLPPICAPVSEASRAAASGHNTLANPSCTDCHTAPAR